MDGLELDRDNWEHFGSDSVELIETSPEASHDKTRENATHGFVVETLAAVSDTTSDGQWFGKILYSLSFTSTSGACRSTTKLKSQGSSQGHNTSVSEGSDDQSSIQALIFVAIWENASALRDSDVVYVVVPVKSQLGLPFEFLLVQNWVSDKPVDNISCVHVNNDKWVDFLSVLTVQICSDQIN